LAYLFLNITLVTQRVERRRPQRVRLAPPLKGSADAQRIYVRDVSLTGLGIAHRDPLGAPGTECKVTIEWDGHKILLRCEMRWSLPHTTGRGASAKRFWHSGMRILDALTPESGRLLLRDLVEHHVARALDEQKANARGIPAVAAQSFQTGASSTFRRHELIGVVWRSSETNERAQPPNGFTVAADHAPAEVEMLRGAYEAADRAGREMIRKLAEMSIASTAGIPTRKYEP
jgi:hypothetical protein